MDCQDERDEMFVFDKERFLSCCAQIDHLFAYKSTSPSCYKKPQSDRIDASSGVINKLASSCKKSVGVTHKVEFVGGLCAFRGNWRVVCKENVFVETYAWGRYWPHCRRYCSCAGKNLWFPSVCLFYCSHESLALCRRISIGAQQQYGDPIGQSSKMSVFWAEFLFCKGSHPFSLRSLSFTKNGASCRDCKIIVF